MKTHVEKLLSALISFCILVTLLSATALPTEAASSEVWDGSISPITVSGDGIYYISNGAELAWMAQEVNAGRLHTASFTLDADIDLGSRQWTPIGNHQHFIGTFDGGNYSITGLSIENGQTYSALFGIVGTAGTVKNFSLSGVVKAALNTEQIGGVAGYNAGTIINVSNSTYVSGATESTAVTTQHIGGIVGMNASSGKVVNSRNTSGVDGGYWVGGIAGTNNGFLRNVVSTQAINSYGVGAGGMIAGQNYSWIQGYYPGGSLNANVAVGRAQTNSTDNSNKYDQYGFFELGPINENTAYVTVLEELSKGATTYNTENPTLTQAQGWFAGESGLSPVLAFGRTKAPNWITEGNPTEPSYSDGVYLVGTPQELAWVADQPSSLFKGETVLLTDNIDLYGYAWEPIERFEGTLDGAGYQITNMYCTTENNSPGGLIYQLYGWGENITSVQNLRVHGNVMGGYFAGGIVATARYATITNVGYSGVLTGGYANVSYFGGIVGEVTNSVISAVYNDADIRSVNAYSQIYAGGIAGIMPIDSFADNPQPSLLINAYNRGDLYILAYNSSSDVVYGGVVGSTSDYRDVGEYNNSSIIVNSYNTGTIYRNETYDRDVLAGGVIGYTGGHVENSYSTGNVEQFDPSIQGKPLATIGGAIGSVVGNGTVTVRGIYCGEDSGHHIIYRQSNAVTENALKALYNVTTEKYDFDIPQTDEVESAVIDGTQYHNILDALNAGVELYNATNPEIEAVPWVAGTLNVNNGQPVHSVVTWAHLADRGAVTDNGDFTITTPEELAFIAQQVNNGRDSFLGQTITLGNDIALGVAPWTAIGLENLPFEGTFDGGGNSIGGINFDQINWFQGLFGHISHNSTVKNLSVAGTVHGYAYVGGIVGINHGLLSNVEFIGAVNGNSNYVGGIAGINSGGADYIPTGGFDVAAIPTTSDNSNGQIVNSRFIGGVSGDDYVGGITGINSGLIDDVLVDGSVMNDAGSNGIWKYVGGIAGRNGNVSSEFLGTSSRGTIINAENHANIAAAPYSGAGGIGGINSFDIINCTNIGNVGNFNFGYLGGIVGNNSIGRVIHSYSSGEVSSGDDATVGGAIGYNNLIGVGVDVYELRRVENVHFLSNGAQPAIGNNDVANGPNGETFTVETASFTTQTLNQLTDALNEGVTEYNATEPVVLAESWIRTTDYPYMPDMIIPTGDVNADGATDQKDIDIVINVDYYNKAIDVGLGSNQLADVNNDGRVNFLDLAIIRNSKYFNQ